MNKQLLDRLSAITAEEEEILSGKTINRSLYYSKDRSDEIDASLVLQNGRMIDLRPHTRFVHFPKHSHNYIEFVYMAKGSTTHYIDGEKIILNEGDLLFLNQQAIQEILPAGKDDIAINFMILPSFFDESFEMIYNENNAIKDFIIGCLTSRSVGSNYIYFKTGGIVPIQNLLENLTWNLLENEPNRRSTNQLTMSLLFLSLINHAETIRISDHSYDRKIVLDVLRYINDNYSQASLSSFAEERKIDTYTLSRIISRQTGSTFTKLLEARRLNQACFLLKNTPLTIDDIASTIGYENLSFFYRLFQREYHLTPREYRILHKEKNR